MYLDKKFQKDGYKIINLLSTKDCNNIVNEICNKINFLNKKKIVNSKNISKFHKLNFDKEEYSKIINSSTRNIKINEKEFTKKILKSDIYNILIDHWGHYKTKIVWVGSAKKKEIIDSRIGFRIARPVLLKKKDTAKEHIDLYSNDRKSFLTIWIPLIGFTDKYSLQIYPGSHIQNHKPNNFEKNQKVISRTFKKSYVKKFSPFRPNLKKGQAIIFDPNIIHGGAINEGTLTRLSVEIRLFNKKNYNINESFDQNLVN